MFEAFMIKSERIQKIINVSLLCGAVFAVGLSLSIMAPFYPSEALKRDVSITMSGE